MSKSTTPDRDDILAEARAAPPKIRLEEYREAVEALRNKGYSWREIADFLTQRGVVTDHTRVYRQFGEAKRQKRRTEKKPVEITRMTYLGEKPTRKKQAWSMMEIELPSKLGSPMTLMGFTWAGGSPRFMLGAESSMSFRETTLVQRTGGRGFLTAHIEAEVQTEDGSWTPQEIHIVPKWEALL